MTKNNDKTINDFGDQWNYLTKNDGYYASGQMLKDILEPLILVETLKGKKICEIGGGTGRIVKMLLNFGVQKITVLEPSSAFDVLIENLSLYSDRVTCLKIKGDQLESRNEFDFICSIGVLHHIPEPTETVKKMYQALKPGGTAFIWVYGQEGNQTYLFFAEKLRRVTKILPDRFLKIICHFLSILLIGYIYLCKIVPLPMKTYMINVVGRYKYYNIFLTIFDQLNPEYSKYYKKVEAESLLSQAGFKNIESFHRHGYSWSVLGVKEKS